MDEAAENDRCPGCGQRFRGGDITGILPWPFDERSEKRRWHLRCHQDTYHAELDRDRRSRIERRMMGDDRT